MMDKQRFWNVVSSFLSGAVLAAIITYFATIDIEERKRSFEARKAAYESFFDAFVLSHQLKRLQSKASPKPASGESEANELSTEAAESLKEFQNRWEKSRLQIGVFSEDEVVQKLATYLRDNFDKPLCGDTAKFNDDVAIYQAIRREMKSGGDVEDRDLAMVLFDCRLEE